MKRLLSVPLIFLAAACGSSDPAGEVALQESGIVGGTKDTGHPAVAVIYNSSQGYLCTGSLIDDQVLLTAAHCVADDLNASHYEIAGGTDPFGIEGGFASWVVGAYSVHAHPQYDDQQLVHDIGIIVLDEAPPVNPMSWQSVVDHDVYAVGTPFTAVGYGITSGDGGAGGDDSGIKRKVDMTIDERYADAFVYGTTTKNTCSGDSGGPALVTIDSKLTVIGVVSYGDQDCAQYGVDMRTDDNADFISSFAGAGPAPTPTPDPGGDDDDDDDGTTDPPGKDEEEEGDPFAQAGSAFDGCSVTGVRDVAMSPIGLLALAFTVSVARRRRE